MIPTKKEDKISKGRSGLSTVLSKLDRDLQHAEEVDITTDNKQSVIL